MIDWIHIEQLEVHARVGVPEKERAEPQRLTLSITLWPISASSDLRDDIANAVNYSGVAEMARQIAGRSSFQLIETLAEEIASELLRHFRARKVSVELRKFVFSDAKFVAVTAICESSEG